MTKITNLEKMRENKNIFLGKKIQAEQNQMLYNVVTNDKE